MSSPKLSPKFLSSIEQASWSRLFSTRSRKRKDLSKLERSIGVANIRTIIFVDSANIVLTELKFVSGHCVLKNVFYVILIIVSSVSQTLLKSP